MKASYKNGVFNFEIDGYAVELYKEGNLWLDKVYTLFGHVINHISSEKSIKFSEAVEAIKADIREAKEIHDFIDSVKFLNESSTKRANIMKIRLTKKQLYRVINESVKQVLSELNWKKYANTERLKRLKRLLN